VRAALVGRWKGCRAFFVGRYVPTLVPRRSMNGRLSHDQEHADVFLASGRIHPQRRARPARFMCYYHASTEHRACAVQSRHGAFPVHGTSITNCERRVRIRQARCDSPKQTLEAGECSLASRADRLPRAALVRLWMNCRPCRPPGWDPGVLRGAMGPVRPPVARRGAWRGTDCVTANGVAAAGGRGQCSALCRRLPC
jgi:hypothetical protein